MMRDIWNSGNGDYVHTNETVDPSPLDRGWDVRVPSRGGFGGFGERSGSNTRTQFPVVIITIILISTALASLSTNAGDADVSNTGETRWEDVSPGAYPSQATGLLNSVFTANHGQVGNDDVLFTTSTAGGRLAFTGNSYSMHLMEKVARVGAERDDALNQDGGETTRDTLVTLFFVDANHVAPKGRDPASWRSNYFPGNDSTDWTTGVPNYRQIIYENLWDGIDLVYTLRGSGLKYDIILHPGADPRDIKFSVSGHEELTVDEYGTLEIRTRLGDDHTIRDSGLVAFYEDDRSDVIPAQFHLIGQDSYTFRLQNWDHTRTVVIDPLVYSTYLGGSEWDLANGITVDDSGCAYVIGYTDSSDFPTTPGAYDTTSNGEYDVFITKLSPEGDSLEYSTYLGKGSDWSQFDIEVDDDGYAYVIGSTSNANFPTTVGAYDTSHGGSDDAFVTKLSPSGDSLVYSTFLGDTKSELGYAIAIDDDGFAYVTGCTSSTDFPTTPGAYDTTYNFQRDVFITKLSQSGDSLVYSTFMGSSKNEDGEDIAVDPSGYAYVTGGTYSSGFPTTDGAYQTTHNGDWDGYVAKLSQSGDSLEYSTFLGGSAGEGTYGIAIDSEGNSFITGRTTSSDFPTTEGAYDRIHNGGYGDVFVTKLAASGGSLLYSTFIGGSERDSGEDITVGTDGYACVTGKTNSEDFPVVAGAYDTTFNGGDNDIFVLNLRPSGGSLEYSTFLGGSNADSGLAIAVDGMGNAFVTGDTSSNDFPTSQDAYDGSIDGYSDAIIAKLSVYLAPIAIIDTISPNPSLDTDLVRFEGHSHDEASIQRYVWRSSLVGELYNDTTAEFETDALPIGEHSIFFRVQDDQDEWSEEVSAVLVITERPRGYIDSITPNPALDTDEILFEGRGTDDGTIERYVWRSSSDGEFYNGTDAEFTNGALSNGTHDIYLGVLDDHGFWSDEVSTTLVINGIPRCEIFEISHSTALETETVFFEGVGSDDSSIIRFVWTSSRDGELYNDTMSEFSTDTLSIGDHIIQLKVQDDSGIWSEVASSGLIITERPVAWIDSISPNPALDTETVIFTGHGTDDGSIVQYLWSSSIDDELHNGSGSGFSLEGLSNGIHEILFKVQDEHGFWSLEATTTLVIHRRPVAVIESILPSSIVLASDTITFTGSGTDDGSINRFLWESDLDGELHNGTESTFMSSGLSTGIHTLQLQVRDNFGVWSNATIFSLIVHEKPFASIVSVTPNPAVQDGDVSINGIGTDDGDIIRYIWRSDLDGELNPPLSVEDHQMFIGGDHQLMFNHGTKQELWVEADYEQYPGVRTNRQWVDVGTWETSPEDIILEADGAISFHLWFLTPDEGYTADPEFRFTLRDNDTKLLQVTGSVSYIPAETITEYVVTGDLDSVHLQGKVLSLSIEYRAWEDCVLYLGDPEHESHFEIENAEILEFGNSTITTSDLSIGNHVLTLKVLDNYGVWSDPVNTSLLVHRRPVAIIEDISPDPVSPGDTVTFLGNGTDDGAIELYVWHSDLDGELYNGTERSFVFSTLSAGTHSISLRVRDDQGVWSEAVISDVEILGDEEDDSSDFILFENIGHLPILAYLMFILCVIIIGGAGSRRGKQRHEKEQNPSPPPFQSQAPQPFPSSSSAPPPPSTDPSLQLNTGAQAPPLNHGWQNQYGQPQGQYTQAGGYIPPVPPPNQVPPGTSNYSQISSSPPDTWSCPQCGKQLENRFAFCLSCGYKKSS